MGKVKALFLSANPDDSAQLHLDEEIREITNRLRGTAHRDDLDLIPAWAARPDDLLQCLMQHQPHIVHFSGHGNQAQAILMLGDDRQAKPVSKEALLSVFATLTDNIRVVLLNSCYSRAQAEAIVQFIDCAIGMSGTIGDEAAIKFAATFYEAIGFNRSVASAFDTARTALLLNGIPEEDTPELLVKDGKAADDIFLLVKAPGLPTTTDVTLVIRMSLADFDGRAKKFLRHAVAEFLEIDHEAVTIVAEEEGSVKVTLRLPYEAGQRLAAAQAAGDPELGRRLEATARLFGRKSLEQHASTPVPTLRDKIRVLVLCTHNSTELVAMIGRQPNTIATTESSLANAMVLLAESRFDAVILHSDLPDSTRFLMLTELQGSAPDVPLLVVAKKSDLELAHFAHQMGAMLCGEGETLSRQYIEQFVQIVAERVAVGEWNRQLEAARQIQSRMFPTTPTGVPGFDIAGRCLQRAVVGGDYFDFIRLPDESLGVVVADAAGHGFGASLLMAQTRAVLRSELRRNFDAREAVDQVNQNLAAEWDAQSFVALHYLRLNPRDRSLFSVAAGLEGYVLGESGNLVQKLASTGMPLGIAPESPMQEVGPVFLKPGNVVLLFTDGIADSKVRDEVFGLERVLACVRSNLEQPASQILDRLFDEIKHFQGETPQTDDMTAIVVRVQGDAESRKGNA